MIAKKKDGESKIWVIDESVWSKMKGTLNSKPKM